MVIIIGGVSGSGKTTVGSLLAKELNWKFYDADDFHSSSNIKKMTDGIPLNDTDRQPWLQSLRDLIVNSNKKDDDIVLACSALKESYRMFLDQDDKTHFIYLKADFELIAERLKKREGHFMNPQLLKSQFETLEEPTHDVIVADARLEPEDIVVFIRKKLNL